MTDKKNTSTKKTSQSENPKKSFLLATGLEDYGKWQSMYQNHQRDENEKPFRRGRIWC
jgi:cyanobactin cluster PatC/TenC/TruC protein